LEGNTKTAQVELGQTIRQNHAARLLLMLFRNIMRGDWREPKCKTIQLLFEGHVSFAQRQTVASFIALRVTK
jgi:hypothetical protein